MTSPRNQSTRSPQRYSPQHQLPKMDDTSDSLLNYYVANHTPTQPRARAEQNANLHLEIRRETISPGGRSPQRTPRSPAAGGKSPRPSLVKSSSYVNNDDALSKVQKKKEAMVTASQHKLEDELEEHESHIQEVQRRRREMSAEALAVEQQELYRVWGILMVHAKFCGGRVAQTIRRAALWKQLVEVGGPVMRKWCKLFLKRLKQKKRVREILDGNLAQKPTVAMLAKVNIFSGWSTEALERIICALTFRVYGAGEVIVHDDDPSFEMFMLYQGAVEVLIRKRKSSDAKRRSRENGIVVFTFKAPCFMGDDSLVSNEARSATLVASGAGGEVWVWVLSRTAFRREFDALPSSIRAEIAARIEQRRQENLARLAKPKMEDILQLPLFRAEGTETVPIITAERAQALGLACKAFGFRPSSTIYAEGDRDVEWLYFLNNGTVTLRHGSMLERKLNKKGDIFGEEEVICSEPVRQYTVVALSTTIVWGIPKREILNILIGNPYAMGHAKEVVRLSRLLWVPTLTISELAKVIGSPTIAAKVHPHLKCVVFCAHEEIVREGTIVDHVVFVRQGGVIQGSAMGSKGRLISATLEAILPSLGSGVGGATLSFLKLVQLVRMHSKMVLWTETVRALSCVDAWVLSLTPEICEELASTT